MLKIKADRMKDLEKFGFKKDAEAWTYDFDNTNNALCVLKSHKELFLFNECSHIPNIVYDLIKADMVEKVVE